MLDDEPQPDEKKKRREDTGGAFGTAAKIINRVARLSADAFRNAAKAITAAPREKFFADADAASWEALDAANPYWDFDTSSGSDLGFDDHRSGPSLDL